MYTLQGKTRSTHHTLFTLDPCMVTNHTSHVVCVGNLSIVPMRSKHTPTLGRSIGDQRQTGPTVILGHLILPPSQQLWSRGERFWPSDYTAILAHWTYIPACDQYVQCLLTRANPSVINRHRWELQLWSCRLSMYHSPIFTTDGLHFPPKGPARYQVKQSNITKRCREGTNPKSHEWESPLDFYRKLSSKHSVC
jgi:hypothetical protein